MAGDFKKTSEEKIGKPTAVTTTKPAATSVSLSEIATGAAGFFSKAQGSPSSNSNVAKLLQLIASGEQDQAKAMLEKAPDLLLKSGKVTDPAERSFDNITGFQLAIWALDWHMWEMLLNYLPSEEAAKQFQALEKNGTDHGKQFDLTPLIETLEAFIATYEDPDSDLSDCGEDWCKKVGAKQALLVAHVAQEYCRLDRAFSPLPSFKEDTLPRARHVYAKWDGPDEWFSLHFAGGKLGQTFAYERGEKKTVMMGSLPYSDVDLVKIDVAALKELSAVRLQQRQSLQDQLLRQSKVKSKEEKPKPDSKEEVMKQKFDGYLKG